VGSVLLLAKRLPYMPNSFNTDSASKRLVKRPRYCPSLPTIEAPAMREQMFVVGTCTVTGMLAVRPSTYTDRVTLPARSPVIRAVSPLTAPSTTVLSEVNQFT